MLGDIVKKSDIIQRIHTWTLYRLSWSVNTTISL